MGIRNHFLTEARHIRTLGDGSPITPTRIVLHYTAGSSLSGAVTTLRKRRLSYNVLIDKDGSLHQARAFNRSAGHAGRSNWKGSSGLNNSSSLNGSSIGISLVNLGLHDYFIGGKWWWDRGSNGRGAGPSVADSEANKLASIYAPNRTSHWQPYTAEQISACHDLIAEILREYPLIDEIVGHDDIAIGYKFDPGPALPLQQWREEFQKEGGLGLAAKVRSPDGELNLRDRPAYMDGRVIQTLRQGDPVHIRSVTYTSANNSAGLVRGGSGRILTGWASVDVDGSNRHSGFVYMGYLTDNPLRNDHARAL